MADGIIQFIKKNKIIAIARNVRPEKIIPTAQALYDGGIRLIEVTFNQGPMGIDDTLKSIKALCSTFGDKMCIGAGTVMNTEQVHVACDAGAKYLISPHSDVNVIKETKRMGLVSIPGAFTPSEFVLAWQSGADFVKVFPAGTLGIAYIKAVMSPVGHIPMLAVGGVNENNLSDFLNAGMKGAGIGSNLVSNKLINEDKFFELTETAKLYTGQL